MSSARPAIGCVAILLCVAASGYAQAPDKRLSVADVEKVSGLKGVAQVARGSMTGAGGDLNFVGPDKKLLLMVNFGGSALYDRAKKQPSLMHAIVPGVGDEAFDAPPGSLQYVLYVKKGANAISITAFFVSGSRPLTPALTLEQLKAIAQIVLPRL